MSMISRRVPLAWVAFILVMILALWAPVPRAQTATKKLDATVVDPQAAIKVAAAAFKQAKPIPNFAAPKTAWGDPDVSGTYLTATYTPLQRPARLKDEAFFTEEEAIAELARVIGQDAEADPRNVDYDWKEY